MCSQFFFLIVGQDQERSLFEHERLQGVILCVQARDEAHMALVRVGLARAHECVRVRLVHRGAAVPAALVALALLEHVVVGLALRRHVPAEVAPVRKVGVVYELMPVVS